MFGLFRTKKAANITITAIDKQRINTVTDVLAPKPKSRGRKRLEKRITKQFNHFMREGYSDVTALKSAFMGLKRPCKEKKEQALKMLRKDLIWASREELEEEVIGFYLDSPGATNQFGYRGRFRNWLLHTVPKLIMKKLKPPII